MRIEAHARLGAPVVAEATRVVIFDDDGNPLMLAVQLSDRSYHVCHLQDPEFSTLVRMLGIDQSLVVCKVPPHPG